MKHAKCYVKDYPRPQFVRPTYQMLNGYWDFCFDDDDRGEKEGWFKRFPKQQVIKVPFTYQTPKSGIHTTTHHPIVWYHRTIRLSPEQLNEKRLLLHFEGCDYYTKMYVNGSFIGNHYGGYTRFTFDLTKVIQPGENTITVRVEDDYGCTKPRGKQRWKDESYYCCYIDTTGIWKSVWLEFVPEWYLKGIKMTPHIEQYTVDIEYTLNAFKKGLKLQTIIFFKDVEVANVTVELKRPFFRQAIDIMSETHHSKINLWNHHEPNLYDVEFRLYDNEQLIDCVGSYFGIRHIGIENSWLTINYTPSYLKMVLDQGYWKDSHLTPPSEEALLLDIERALAMGFNGIRMHQKIEDERFYYYCDILGIYVGWKCHPFMSLTMRLSIVLQGNGWRLFSSTITIRPSSHGYLLTSHGVFRMFPLTVNNNILQRASIILPKQWISRAPSLRTTGGNIPLAISSPCTTTKNTVKPY